MDSEIKNIFKCNVCSSRLAHRVRYQLTPEQSILTTACNETNSTKWCSSVTTAIRPFALKKSLYHHRRIAKHPIGDVVNAGEAIESTPEEAQDVYSSNGRIQTEISHEKNA